MDHAKMLEMSAGAAAVPVRHPFAMCTELTAPFYRNLEKARETVSELAGSCDPHLAKKLNAVLRRIDGFEPKVTLVGQVKAGKTAIANVLSGHAGLLPSDVNPLTSVITTLHLNTVHPDGHTRAAFELFGREEWDNLLKDGGRLGELASRAGAEDELPILRRQIEQMRETARNRIGPGYEALLGKVHKYGYCDADLVERYVCLGDPDDIEEDAGNRQGLFADVTRSADLYVDQPHLPGAIALRDTPGVNDTFMVREQITLRSLADSQVCVVILSAHEALNTTDLALVRLISAVEHRQLVLFVNRIDELARPSEQIPEIRDSILRTLSTLNAAKRAAILFGSARWAEVALSRDFGDMDDEQRKALFDWASATGTTEIADAFEFTWLLSGMPALMTEIYHRILDRSGKRLVDGIRRRLNNAISEMRAKGTIDPAGAADRPGRDLDALAADIDALIEERCTLLDETLNRLVDDLRPRLRRVQDNYVARATAALVTHLKQTGPQDTWTFGSSGLRFVLKSTYVRFAGAAMTEIEDVYQGTANGLRDLYVDRLGVRADGFAIEPPQVPAIPPPVVLGQTIAIDLGSTWWKRWWQRRRGIESCSEDYSRLIRAEVGSIIHDLESTQFDEVLIEMRTILREFLAEQKDTILRLAGTGAAPDAAAAAESDQQDETLIEALDEVVCTLDHTSAAA